jgi:replicative DNA helicase
MNYSEQVIYSHLTNADSLDIIAKEGFNNPVSLEVIPTEAGRRLITWTLRYFFDSNRMIAPSKEAILETWGEVMEATDISIEDEVETDTVQWAIETLRSNHVKREASEWAQTFSRSVYEADSHERVTELIKGSQRLHQLAEQVRSRRHEMDGLEGVDDAIMRYNQRVAEGNSRGGMMLGIPEIDDHMYGTHPGEITTICSASGIGKSWCAGHIAYSEFTRGRRAVLVTLENDIEMSYDRLVCMAAKVHYESWQRAEALPEEMTRVAQFREQMDASEKRPLVSQLPMEERTPSAIVRHAQMQGADSLIIDQLSFMRPEASSKMRERHSQVAEMMHKLKELVSGDIKMPVVLMAQINREGISAARKEGRFYKDHLADSAEVERTSDFLWAIYQDSEMALVDWAEWQSLKARRTSERHFRTIWRPQVGDIRVLESDITIGKKTP